MPYQTSQPLGNSLRGGGGGWKFLSAMSGAQGAAPEATQDAALKAGAGPVSAGGATDYFRQQAAFQSALGMGSNTVSGSINTAQSLSGYKNAYAGYTGKPQAQAGSKNSY